MAAPLRDLVAPDWAEALDPVETQVAAMGEFLRSEVAAGRGYLPAGSDVLRAFTYPLSQVRVVILGQDPYPTPGHPIGLSFAVAPEVSPLPGSLRNIFTELGADMGVPEPSNGDLRPWAQRGVLLLNRVLTVRPGAPASHRGKGWEEITGHAVDSLITRGGPLVAILWGRQAQETAPSFEEAGVPVISSPHPSPLSASRGFYGSRPFSRANEALVEAGAEPIDWTLP